MSWAFFYRPWSVASAGVGPFAALCAPAALKMPASTTPSGREASKCWTQPFSKAKRRNNKSVGSSTAGGRTSLRCTGTYLYIYLLAMIALAACWLPLVRSAATSAGEDEHRILRALRNRGTFYDILGVSPRSSQTDIKRVFRKLARKMHPDKRGPYESPQAEEMATDLFVKILKAYETLVDPLLRQRYDTNGETADKAAEEHVERSYEDAPFGLFVRFGGGRGGMWFRYKGHGTRHAPDLTIPMELTLEEVFDGKQQNITVTRERLCKACGATGSANPEGMSTCPLCEGKGYAYHLFGVHEENNSGSRGHGHDGDHHHRCSADTQERAGVGRGRVPIPEYAHAVNTTCKACGGMGKLSERDCPICRGRKVNVETETFEVTIPPGAMPGHIITFAGKGPEHPDRVSGHVRVVAVQLPHPRFKREGNNLLYEAKISLIDALLGFERKLTLLNGTRVAIVHDQGALFGFRQDIPNKGFPTTGEDGANGSLIVSVKVDFPRRLTEEHLELLRVVLTAEEIAVLEDVLKLMSATKNEERSIMDPLEFRFSRLCSDDEYPICTPDLLWWARPIDSLMP